MNDLAKENFKRYLAIGMIVLAGFVLFSVFGTPAGGNRAAIPSLVSVFGVKFGVIFLIFLFGYCYYFNMKKGFWWVVGIWIVTTPFYFLGASVNLSASLSGFARIITGNSCLSALAIGINVLRGKL